MTDLILETLPNGNARITARLDGRAIESIDGPAASVKEIYSTIQKKALWMHKISEGIYDMTFVRLNDALKAAIA